MKLKSFCGPRRGPLYISRCTLYTHIVYLWPFRFLLGLGHIRTLFAITDHGLELGVEKKPLRTLYIYIHIFMVYILYMHVYIIYCSKFPM